MKYSYTKSLLITISFACTAHAEVETFDMALTGEFAKDYCEVTYMIGSGRIQLPGGSPGGSPGPMIGGGGHTVNTNSAHAYSNIGPVISDHIYVANSTPTSTAVQCSAGVYNFTLTNTESGVATDGSSYQIFSLATALDKDSNVVASGYFDASTPLNANGLTAVDGTQAVRFSVTAYIAPLDNNPNSLPDSYSHTFNNIITIEKQ